MNQPLESGATAPSAEHGALLTTGEMARRSGNTLRTVRFYEEEGILRAVRRTDGGHRLFDEPELERLTLVTDMRSAGLSLDEIKHILEVKQGPPPAPTPPSGRPGSSPAASTRCATSSPCSPVSRRISARRPT